MLGEHRHHANDSSRRHGVTSARTTGLRRREARRPPVQRAPADFGGHKEAAIDALNHALNELNQAIHFDKK
jgi:hypothetical protein